MIDLQTYLNGISSSSKFDCEIGKSGGFLNFKNTGQGGTIKEFTLSLTSILSGLEDIKSNLGSFISISTYEEKKWRDTGSRYFNDLALNTMITVQTKSCFTTLSKVINWANSVTPHNDNLMLITGSAIDNAIDCLEKLSLLYTPSKTPTTQKNSTHLGVSQHTRVSKPFMLLAGISGTGKSRFVREQAKASGSLSETYQLVSVRPDWHEPSDLLGYTTRLGGKAEYIVTEVLTFLVKAWKAIVAEGVVLEGNNASGTQATIGNIAPYWLCLDEMNLAPVEQYFADYLSVLETREWQWEGDAFNYQCDPILSASVLAAVDSNLLRKELNLDKDIDEPLWQHFCANGIGLPFNLIVAGTVNMDETTHGLSRKVIDRALSFDFGEFFPNNFTEYFSPQSQPKILSYPVWSDGRDISMTPPNFDHDGQKSIAFLTAVNEVLLNTPFQLAYRAANELLLSVMTASPQTKEQLMAVWDDFMMCKVLPRIEGDIDKLAIVDTNPNDGQETILSKLEDLLSQQLDTIWEGKNRPDLYRDAIVSASEELLMACHSRQKIAWMNSRLKTSGFTSFWP